MAPAKDRAPSMITRRWYWLGLVLVIGSTQPGCSRLTSRGNDPPMLGRVVDTNQTYANAHAPKASTSPTSLASAVGSEAGAPVVVDEVGLAIRSTESTEPAEAPEHPVTLLPPTAVDPKADAVLALATAPAHTPRPAPATDPAVQVVAEARAALNSLGSYQVAIHRQERVDGNLLPDEDVIIAVRRQPRAVRLTWPNGPNQGREAIYRSDEPGGQMHVKLANPALPRMTLDPNSPLVMRNSRHPVTEAGFESIVDGLEAATRDPNASGLVYAGVESAIGLDHPCHSLGLSAPDGERRRIYLDPATHLPALVLAFDARGELLERYLFRDVRADPAELAAADAFDPVARWGQPKGLFGRLAQGQPDSR